jgi:branched-chain amino acid transport system permease protein
MRAAPWLTVAALASVPLWLNEPYFLHVLIIAGIFTIAAMSLNLLLGYTGQLSLGHVAFFGIGAYASALTSLGFDVNVFGVRVVHEPWPAIAGFFVGILLAGTCGYAIGKLSFKVRGAYFVIVTISFAEVTRLVALNWVELTQGPLALNNIPPFTLAFPGLGEYTMWGKVPNYYALLAVGAVAYVVIRRLVLSRIGRAMIALRENEPLATSVGIDVTRYLVLAAVISAGIAGAAGGLYAHFVRIIDPQVFLFIYTVTMVIMVITGGKGTLAGPLVGGLIFGVLPVVLREYASPVAQWIAYGALMIAVVFFLPRGIVPAVTEWWAGRRAALVHPSTSALAAYAQGERNQSPRTERIPFPVRPERSDSGVEG